MVDNRSVRLSRERLQVERRKQGWSQEILARRAGVKPNTIKNAERECPVLLSTAECIAKAFGLSSREIEARNQHAPARRPRLKLKIGESGSADTQFEKGCRFTEPLEGEEPNYKEALKCFLVAAKQDHAEAAFRIGQLYHDDFDALGLGEWDGYGESEAWYRRAAELGWAEAQFIIGQRSDLASSAEGFRDAVRWYEKAAHQNHREAQFELSELHWKGWAPHSSWDEALRWLTAAAEGGYVPAEVKLALLYLEGSRVNREPEKAFRLLKSAAEKKDSDGQFWLAKLYLAGSDVPRDTDRALGLMRCAAKNYQAEAALFLAADAYEQDPPDWVGVYYWANLAGAFHDKEIRNNNPVYEQAYRLFCEAKGRMTKKQLWEASIRSKTGI